MAKELLEPKETSYTLKKEWVALSVDDNEYPDDPWYELTALVTVTFINNEYLGEKIEVDEVHFVEHARFHKTESLKRGDKDFVYYANIVIDAIVNREIDFD